MTEVNDVRHDSTVTWNWFRMNVPTIIAIASVGLYINNGLLKAAERTEAQGAAIVQIRDSIAPMGNLEYRLTRAETHLNEAHVRIDNLSNTMINNIDLIRRDVNRLTTQVEVLSSQIGILFGEEKVPVQRRARPGGPISVD